MQERGRTRSASYRRRKTPPITLPVLHERKVLDPPIGARVVADVIDNPLAAAESAARRPAQRRDGSRAATGEGEWLAPGAEQIVVLRSIRTDPLGWMRSHGQLGEAEYLAGRQWQRLHELAALGRVQAVDTTKEPVDGGRIAELLTDGQRVAMAQLRDGVAAVAGSAGDRLRGELRLRLLQGVLVDGVTIREFARLAGIERHGAGREFGAALAVLAAAFGFRSGRDEAPRRRIRGWRAAA